MASEQVQVRTVVTGRDELAVVKTLAELVAGDPPGLRVAVPQGGSAVVFVYVKDGELVVSVDLDDVESGDPVPMRIAVQGTTVWASGSGRRL